MHSSLVRTQNVFGYFTSVAFATALCVAVSVLLSSQSPSASIQLRNVQVVKGRPHYHSNKKEEYAHIKFDLDTDLSSLFDWNTKQVFVWLTATYPPSSPAAPPSQAVIWDQIINSKSQLSPYTPFDAYDDFKAKYLKSPSKAQTTKKSSNKKKPEKAPTPGIVRLKNSKPKYQITDISGKLASQHNVTLELGWNVQPWVGALLWTTKEGQGFGRWAGVQGGISQAFDLPSLKGKSAEQVVEKGTPKPAEASPVV